MKIVTNLLPLRLLQKIKETCFFFLEAEDNCDVQSLYKIIFRNRVFLSYELIPILDFKMIQMGFKIFTALETGLGNSEIFIPRTKA